MAKQTKNRRASMSKAQPRSYSELYGNRETPSGPSAASVTPAAPARRKVEEVAPRRSADTVDWKNEYSKVLGDVRQLLVISAALFVLMVVLGFII
ncbi:MAG: hypothetical protein KJZ86_21790 [Caldilineaceae bacterium]|nr:hypothetical protein [Caldilineaceae bacterium]HRJ43148.1 hypothetical protein [Caldilineaceae bacterium]